MSNSTAGALLKTSQKFSALKTQGRLPNSGLKFSAPKNFCLAGAGSIASYYAFQNSY